MMAARLNNRNISNTPNFNGNIPEINRYDAIHQVPVTKVNRRVVTEQIEPSYSRDNYYKSLKEQTRNTELPYRDVRISRDVRALSSPLQIKMPKVDSFDNPSQNISFEPATSLNYTNINRYQDYLRQYEAARKSNILK
jgi:hypothetical protein